MYKVDHLGWEISLYSITFSHWNRRFREQYNLYISIKVG